METEHPKPQKLQTYCKPTFWNPCLTGTQPHKARVGLGNYRAVESQQKHARADHATGLALASCPGGFKAVARRAAPLRCIRGLGFTGIRVSPSHLIRLRSNFNSIVDFFAQSVFIDEVVLKVRSCIHVVWQGRSWTSQTLRDVAMVIIVISSVIA